MMAKTRDVDYRAEQSVIREQGDRPTCVGFAVSAAHEWMARSRSSLSPEDAIWAGHQAGGPPTEEATSVDLALRGLAKNGHASEDAWPYGRPPWPADRPAAAQDDNSRSTLPVWRRCTAVSLAILEEELEDDHAVVLTLAFVPPVWYRAAADGFVDADHGRPVVGNHAVLAVGILDIGSANPRIVIKNSWGEPWGAGGFGFVSARYIEHYGVAAHVLERNRSEVT
jgi:C1A family cysteine protease